MQDIEDYIVSFVSKVQDYVAKTRVGKRFYRSVCTH
jgi:hypothetical protein